LLLVVTNCNPITLYAAGARDSPAAFLFAGAVKDARKTVLIEKAW